MKLLGDRRRGAAAVFCPRWRGYRHRTGLALDLRLLDRRCPAGAVFAACNTPESRSASASQHKLDVGGLLSLIVALVLVESVYQQGPRLGLEQPAVVDHDLAGALAAGTILSATACAKARRR